MENITYGIKTVKKQLTQTKTYGVKVAKVNALLNVKIIQKHTLKPE